MIKIKLLILLVGCFSVCSCLPVVEKKEPEAEKKAGPQDDDWELNLEYGRYLKEVIQALESDPEFRKKLETADVDDIKSGKISRDIPLIDHNIRSKLDELKRRELERLRHIAVKEHEKKNGVDRSKLKIPTHVDHRNPERFESEDLRKLILQLNKDLEGVDGKREEEFKSYELEKQYKYQQELKAAEDEAKKQELMKQHEQQLKKHQQHPKLHHPGSKQQFEEVWEEQDHMKGEEFDPRTFFHAHDLDNNGFWDEVEVKSLFQKELDKMYDPNASEDDAMERYEEMERMRKHVFSETDLDKNMLISFDEFLEQTKKSEFDQDEGWQGLDEQEMYSQQEYEAYERQRNDEIQRMVESGQMQPPPGYHAMSPHNIQPMVGVPVDVPAPPGYQAVAVPAGYHGDQQGYQGAPQGYQGSPQGYQGAPQGYQGAPQGYQGAPQGYQGAPQGYQGAPQGYQVSPQGYQGAPQGYQGAPQGYHAVPQGQAMPAGGYQAVPQGHGEIQAKVNPVPNQETHQAQGSPQQIQANAKVQQAQVQPKVQQGVPQGQPPVAAGGGPGPAQGGAVKQVQGQAPVNPEGANYQQVPQKQFQQPPKQPQQQQPFQQQQFQQQQKPRQQFKQPQQQPDQGQQQADQQYRQGGIVLQHQQNLNDHAELKPIDNNHLPSK